MADINRSELRKIIMTALYQISVYKSTKIKYDTNEVIKELLERELARKGQVFYVHNNVTTIYEKATYLQSLVKDARIGIVHGQMEKDDIEDVMIKFYNGEI